MRHIAGVVRSHILIGIATVVLIGLHIPSAAAQPNDRQAGVVTKLRGSATVAHAASALPVNLRFKDPVFLGDTVNVRENSVARLLLGDRALVTLRELSIFRLTEEVDRAVIDLNIGKLSLAVLRKMMGAGELIEVRTPNAIAAVRGTVLIAEFDPGADRSGDSQSGEPKTTFSLLEGTVTVSCGALSIGTMPQSGGAGGDTVVINQYEQVTVTGSNCGPVTRFHATDAAKLLAGLQAPLEADTSSTDATGRIAQVELDKALALASYLAPGPVTPRPPTGVQPPVGGPPAESGKEPSSQIGSTSGGGSPETSPPTASSSLSAPTAPPADQAGLIAAPEIGVPKPEACRKPSSRPSLDAQPSLGDRTQNADTTGCDVTDQQLVAASEPILQGEAGPSTNTSSVLLPTQGLHFPIVSTTQQTAGLLPGGSGGGTGPGSGGGSGGGNSGGTPITAVPVVINGGTTTLGPTQTIGSFPGNQTNPGSNPLVQINNGTVNQNPSGSIVQVPPGSTVTTGGPALVVTNSTINAPGSTLVDVEGTLKSTGSPLIDLQNSNTNIGTILDVGPNAQVMAPGTILNQNGGTTTINQGGILVHDNSQLMGGQLITNNNGTITVNNGPLVGANNSSSITTTSMSPAIQLNGGSLTLGPGGSGLSLTNHSTATLGGPAIGVTNGTITGPNNTLINVQQSTLTSNKGPLVDLMSTNMNIGTIFNVGPNGQVTAVGPILNQNGGTTTINQGGILVHDNSQLTGGQLVNSTNGAITVNNGPLVGVTNNSTVTTTSNAPAIQTTGGSLTLGPGSSGLSVTNHSTAMLTGPILGTNGTAITTNGGHLVNVSGNSSLTSPSMLPAIQVTGGSLTLGNGSSALSVTDHSTVTLGGPAVGVINSTITGPSNTLINVQQSMLTSNKGPLVDLMSTNMNIGTIFNVGPNGQVTAVGPILNQNGGTTTINQGGILVHDNSQLTGGQLVNTTNASLVVNGGPLAGVTNNSTITTTSTNPAIQMSGGSLTLGPGSSGLSITDHSTATLTGPIVGTNGTAVTINGGHLVNVSGNSSLTSLSTTPAIQMTGGSLTLGPGSSALSVTDHSTVNVGGPVFQALGTTLRANGSHAPLINISGGSSLTAGGRLLDIRNTSLSMPGQPVVRVADGSRLTTTAGPAFCVIDGSLTADSLLQSIGTPANPINIRGPLFHLERGSAQLGQLLDNDSQRGSTTITLGTGEPVVTMKDSTLTLTKDGAPLVALGGAIPRTQTGVSLIADNSTISTKGPVLELQNLSYTDSNPQLQLTNSKTTVTGTSSIVEVKSGTSSIAGLLLKASGGTITAMNLRSPHHDDGEDDDKDDDRDGKGHHGKPISAGGGLLEVKPGAVLEHKATTSLIMTDRTNLKLDQGLIKIDRGELATKATQSLVMINEGTHSIATASGSAMFELQGTNVDNHGLGTDQPLHGGKPGTPAALAASLLEATGATITTESAVKVDRALLSATQPLLELKSNTRVTANTSALTLTRGGQILETGDYLVGLDCSRFTVRNGSFLSLVGDNLVKVQGDLLVLRNGSIVTLEAPKNGFLISASGASVVEILGSLVRFGGTGGNVLRVANELKPTKVINGIPVRLSGGATTSQVVIEGTPIENPTLGKITNLEGGTFKGSLINVEGTQAKVIIRGR